MSGLDKNFDFENAADKIMIAASDIKAIISDEMYNALLADNVADKLAEALELLRYAMAPMVIYHNMIWIQLRVSNSGITTVKSNDETTAYKYQTDEAKDNLLISHGIFLKELIDFLNANALAEGFISWKNSDQKKAFDALLIKNYREFDMYFNTEGNAAFFVRSRVFQQEAFDEINAHIKIAELLAAQTPDTFKLGRVKKALAYITISKALFEWDNYFLPTTIRRAIASETTKSSSNEDIKQKLSAKYRNMADGILLSIDNDKAVEKQSAESPNDPISTHGYVPDRNDKFISMI